MILPKEALKPVECARWEAVPRRIQKDVSIDLMAIRPGTLAGRCRIQVYKNRNLIVRGKPGTLYKNLFFELNGNNMLLLHDLRMDGMGVPALTVRGGDCWVICQGTCSMEATQAPYAICLDKGATGLKICCMAGSHFTGGDEPCQKRRGSSTGPGIKCGFGINR